MSVMRLNHYITGATLYEAAAQSLRELVERAVAAGVDLADANLGGASLTGANLSGAYLVGAYLADANFGGASLTGANLSGAYLVGANLRGANLGGAYLGGAHLSDANISRANLTGANLGGADFGGVIGINRATTGWFARHSWSCIQQGPTDPLLLRYGCESHPLDAWTEDMIGKLCAKHAPDDALLPAHLRALVQFCKAVQP